LLFTSEIVAFDCVLETIGKLISDDVKLKEGDASFFMLADSRGKIGFLSSIWGLVGAENENPEDIVEGILDEFVEANPNLLDPDEAELEVNENELAPVDDTTLVDAPRTDTPNTLDVGVVLSAEMMLLLCCFCGVVDNGFKSKPVAAGEVSLAGDTASNCNVF